MKIAETAEKEPCVCVNIANISVHYSHGWNTAAIYFLSPSQYLDAPTSWVLYTLHINNPNTYCFLVHVFMIGSETVLKVNVWLLGKPFYPYKIFSTVRNIIFLDPKVNKNWTGHSSR